MLKGVYIGCYLILSTLWERTGGILCLLSHCMPADVCLTCSMRAQPLQVEQLQQHQCWQSQLFMVGQTVFLSMQERRMLLNRAWVRVQVRGDGGVHWVLQGQ